MRRPIRKPRTWKPDLEYKSEGVARFINAVMWDGKKDTARRVVYDAFSKIKEGGANPLETFEAAIRNASPLMEVRSRRVGGAYRWLIGSARSKKGRPMADKLAEELSLAAKNEGEAIKKKDEMHRMAEANKAFAHFAW